MKLIVLILNTLAVLLPPLLAVAVMSAIAWALGRRLLSLRAEDPLLRASARMTCGLGIMITALFFAGILGGFRAPWLLLVAVGLALAGRWRGVSWREADRGHVAGSAGWALAFVGLGVQPALLRAFYPPTDFDVTLYHLPFVQAFLASGELVSTPHLRYAVFTQGAEILATPLFLFGGEVAAALLSTLATGLVGLGLIGLGRRRRRGYVAAALWFGAPLTLYLGRSLMVEPLLTLFVFFGVVAVWRLIEDRQIDSGHATSATTWAIFGGAMLGLAASCKYLGLFFLGSLPPLLLFSRHRRQLPLMVVTAMLLAAPCYVRLAVETGNPLFPFATSIFGESAWMLDSSSGENSFKTVEEQGAALPELAEMFLGIVLTGGYWGTHPQLSPWTLLLLPALLLLRPTREHICITVPLVAYVVLWTFLPNDPRFLLPIVPWLGWLLASGLEQVVPVQAAGRASRRRRLALCGALAAPAWLLANLSLWELGPPPLHPQAREKFLKTYVGGYASLDGWRNDDEAGHIYLFGRENLRYYTDGHGRGDHMGVLNFAQVSRLGRRDPCRLADTFLESGVTHLMVNGRWSSTPLAQCFRRVNTRRPDNLFRAMTPQERLQASTESGGHGVGEPGPQTVK